MYQTVCLLGFFCCLIAVCKSLHISSVSTSIKLTLPASKDVVKIKRGNTRKWTIEALSMAGVTFLYEAKNSQDTAPVASVTVMVTNVVNMYVPGDLHESLVSLQLCEFDIFIPISPVKLSGLFEELSPASFQRLYSSHYLTCLP